MDILVQSVYSLYDNQKLENEIHYISVIYLQILKTCKYPLVISNSLPKVLVQFQYVRLLCTNMSTILLYIDFCILFLIQNHCMIDRQVYPWSTRKISLVPNYVRVLYKRVHGFSVGVVPFHMPIQNSGHKAISSPLSIDGDVRTCPPPAASPVSAGYWEANITRSVNIRRIRIYNPKGKHCLKAIHI